MDIQSIDLNKIISRNEKIRLNYKYEEWKDLGLLNGYFGYFASEILKKANISYNDMLELLLYATFEEERLLLDEYSNILFKSVSFSLYQQGMEEIGLKKSKNRVLNDDLILSFLSIPIDGIIYSEYVKALSLTNSQEIKKLGIFYISNNNKVNTYDELFERTFEKQRNRLLCISEKGISGRLDLQCTTLGNYAYLQAGIDTNTRYVKFVSDFCENVTKMCSNMDGIIFDIKGDNKFHRWWGHDSKHLTYREIECFGLVQGINMPPIMQHFHWCHSTLTYQTELSTDKIRKLMKNDNIKDQQPLSSFIDKETKKDILGSSQSINKFVKPHDKMKKLGKLKTLTHEKAIKLLEKYEKEIVDSDIENAIIILEDGSYYQCYGVKDNVYPYDDLSINNIKKNILYITHNHPEKETNYSFDGDDRRLWGNHEELLILRHTDNKYISQFSRLDNDVDNSKSYSIFDEIFEEDYQHEFNIEYARSNGYGYKRTKRNDV